MTGATKRPTRAIELEISSRGIHVNSVGPSSPLPTFQELNRIVEFGSERLSEPAWEVEAMFVRVGDANDVAKGEMRAFDVAGTKVNVVNADGHLYAFDDTCTHAGCSLARGELEGTTVTCACHGSQFDVTSGAVLRGPAQRPVRSRPVQVEGADLLTEA